MALSRQQKLGSFPSGLSKCNKQLIQTYKTTVHWNTGRKTHQMTISNIIGAIVVKLTLWKRFDLQVYKLFSNTIYWFGFCFMKMRWAPIYCNDTNIPMHYFFSCRDSSCVCQYYLPNSVYPGLNLYFPILQRL